MEMRTGELDVCHYYSLQEQGVCSRSSAVANFNLQEQGACSQTYVAQLGMRVFQCTHTTLHYTTLNTPNSFDMAIGWGIRWSGQ